MTAAALRVERAKARVILVTQDALAFLHQPASKKEKPRERALNIVRGYKRRALDDVRALLGQTLTRPDTGETLTITRRDQAALLALVDGLLGILARRVKSTGHLEVLTPISRPLVAAWASKRSPISPRTFTRWMGWLAASGVIVYAHGRARHCGLVGFPELHRHYRSDGLESLQRAEANAPSWWAPVLRTLRDDVAGAENVVRLDEYRRQYDEEEAQKAEAKTVAVLANVAAKHEREKQAAEERAREARRQLIELHRAERDADPNTSLADELRRAREAQAKRLRELRQAERERERAELAREQMEGVARRLGELAGKAARSDANQARVLAFPENPRGHEGHRNHPGRMFLHEGKWNVGRPPETGAPAPGPKTMRTAAQPPKGIAAAPDGAAGDGIDWVRLMAAEHEAPAGGGNGRESRPTRPGGGDP